MMHSNARILNSNNDEKSLTVLKTTENHKLFKISYTIVTNKKQHIFRSKAFKILIMLSLCYTLEMQAMLSLIVEFRHVQMKSNSELKYKCQSCITSPSLYEQPIYVL